MLQMEVFFLMYCFFPLYIYCMFFTVDFKSYKYTKRYACFNTFFSL